MHSLTAAQRPHLRASSKTPHIPNAVFYVETLKSFQTFTTFHIFHIKFKNFPGFPSLWTLSHFWSTYPHQSEQNAFRNDHMLYKLILKTLISHENARHYGFYDINLLKRASNPQFPKYQRTNSSILTMLKAMFVRRTDTFNTCHDHDLLRYPL